MKKKYTAIHFTLLGIMLIYGFHFYSSISIEIAVLVAIFSMIKPNLFMTAIKEVGIKRIICGTLALIIIGLDLLAISSSFINKYNNESVSKSINTEYVKQQDKIKQLKSNIANIETELTNYPTLEGFTAKSPKWEDKTELNKTWQDGKKDITNRLNTANAEYTKELSTNIDKYKTTTKNNGYNAIFTSISKKTGVKTGSLVQMVYMIIAVLLEIMILYTKTQKEKESKNYVKSPKELMADLIEKINYNMHIKILESFENFSNNLLLATVQKTIEPEPEIKQIEDKKLNKILEQNEQILLQGLTQKFEQEQTQKSDPGAKEILEEVPEGKSIKKCNKILSQKYKGKTFKKKDLNESVVDKANDDSNVKNDENITLKPIINLVKTDKENSPKVLSEKTDKKIDKVLSARIKKVKIFLSENFEPGECITASKIKIKFKLKDHEYRKVLEHLKNDNVVYTDNKKTYLSGKLKAVR